MNKVKIAMLPYECGANKYIELIKAAILRYDNIEIKDYSKVIHNKKQLKQIQYIVLNWFENMNTQNLVKGGIDFLKRIIRLIQFRIYGIRVIWVVHNRLPHDTTYTVYPKLLMRLMTILSYKIVIHSQETTNMLKELIGDRIFDNMLLQKIKYIPHPNYVGAYSHNEKDSYYLDNKEKKIKFLFIGRIMPYKNIEMLIDIFNDLEQEKVELTIAGKPKDQAYENELLERIKSTKRIKTTFKFVPDEEIVDMIKQSDICILPYDIKSSLNSGTIILAFSNGKTVLSPEIGTLKDYTNNKESFFAYKYKEENEHKEILKQKVREVITRVQHDNGLLEKMGRECYELVLRDNNIENIAKCYQDLFGQSISHQ